MYGAYTRGLWRFNHPSSSEYPVQGLDVSHHQGVIDWNAVPKDRVRFVYIKATEGGDYRDDAFLRNWNGARGQGFSVGAYHFFTLCRDAKTQAENFIAAVPLVENTLPPAVDLEFAGNCKARPRPEEFQKELHVFIDAVEARFGVRPIPYTTAPFYKRYLQGSAFAEYPVWIRSVAGKPSAALFPSWALWQYADNARVKGIAGAVDLNLMRAGSLPVRMIDRIPAAQP